MDMELRGEKSPANSAEVQTLFNNSKPSEKKCSNRQQNHQSLNKLPLQHVVWLYPTASSVCFWNFHSSHTPAGRRMAGICFHMISMM